MTDYKLDIINVDTYEDKDKVRISYSLGFTKDWFSAQGLSIVSATDYLASLAKGDSQDLYAGVKQLVLKDLQANLKGV